jgi:hypothetical protein
MTDFDAEYTLPTGFKDPKYNYRWVLDDAKFGSKNLTKRQVVQGYQAVKVSDTDGKKLSSDPRVALDGTIRVGDSILMKCPIANYKKRRHEIAIRSDHKRVVRQIAEEFHSEGARLGLPTFEDPTPGEPK